MHTFVHIKNFRFSFFKKAVPRRDQKLPHVPLAKISKIFNS